MSFVARRPWGAEEKGTGAVCSKGMEGGGVGQNARKCHPSNPRAPRRTRIKCSEIQIINNNDNEERKRRPFLRVKRD